jgi:hypothetical protein
MAWNRDIFTLLLIREGADKSLAFPILLFAAQPKEFLLDKVRTTKS